MAKDKKNDEYEDAPAPAPAPAPAAAAAPAANPDDFKTEQEKGPADPVGEAIEPQRAEISKLGRHEPMPQGKKKEE